VRITVLAGGVGAARFLDGLVRVVDPAEVTVVCNVGDDFEWHGLHISPDIDSVIYTLGGLEGEQGWGVRGDTFVALGELEALGEERWFAIGDRDLATHVLRTSLLRTGATLSEATARLASARGIGCALLPVTDDPAPTVVHTDAGTLAFQEYFVRRRASDSVSGFDLSAAERALPAPGVLDAIGDAEAVLIAPSNPFVSIGPVLAIPGVRDALTQSGARRVAVSPIVGGAAIKGPAAEMLRSTGHEVSALGVARLYMGILDVFVLDEVDAALASSIEELGFEVAITDTMMTSTARREELAAFVLAQASR
jgi:LPPG:FO 2-phospho-L-lactate transferase